MLPDPPHDAPRPPGAPGAAGAPGAPGDAALVEALLRPGAIRAAVQPLFRVADGALVGFEALARTDVTPLPPDAWLAAADRADRRLEVETACLEAAIAAGVPADGALLFVNVSPETVLSPGFAALVSRLPRHVLEITEDAAVHSYDALRGALLDLRASGSLVAVDDVGSGYASLAHVLHLSPSFVKIDMSLVQGMATDPGRRALVRALQTFASAIGALTVAEGVETADELRALRGLGVDLAQGYLLGRPAAPWGALTPEGRRVLLPADLDEPDDLTDLGTALRAAATPAEACEAVAVSLAGQGGLLPSVYLERGGVLRCQSRRGQWLVMDGLQPGSGVTGTAFARGAEVLVPDVAADADYRAAVPGVRAELAVPLRVGGRVVGVCNVDAVVELTPARCAVVRGSAALLERRLAELPASSGAEGAALHELSRLGPSLALAQTPGEVASALLAAVAEVTGCDTGALWTLQCPVSGVALMASHGPAADALVELPAPTVRSFGSLVARMSSCSSGGTDLSLAVPPTQVLSEHGARGAVVVPVRDGHRLTDVLVMTSAASSWLAPEVVVAAEHLCLQAGGRLASLRRVAVLEAELREALAAPSTVRTSLDPAVRRRRPPRAVNP